MTAYIVTIVQATTRINVASNGAADMNYAESKLVYEDMKRRDEIINEIEKLRPSDNPFLPMLDIFVGVCVILVLTKTVDFDIAPENIMIFGGSVVMTNMLIMREINRRTHKRIDALYRLMDKLMVGSNTPDSRSSESRQP
jgi:hypothetical protein